MNIIHFTLQLLAEEDVYVMQIAQYFQLVVMQNTDTSDEIFVQNSLPVIIVSNIFLDRQTKRHHVYKDSWTFASPDYITTEREPDMCLNRYNSCVKKDTNLGFTKNQSERFAKSLFYFLKPDSLSPCYAKIAKKTPNLGD